MSRSRDMANMASRHADNKTGLIAFFAQATAPDGWLECNGAAVSRTTYADLFAEVGTDHGAGDGTTTFNLPDLRGEFIRGWDNGRGVDGARVRGSAQADAMQGHKHQARVATSITGSVGSAGEGIMNSGTAPSDGWVEGATSDGTNGTPRTAPETRPRNIALLGCIKT